MTAETRALLQDSHHRHDARALFVFALDGASYAGCLAGTVLSEPFVLKLLFSSLAGLFITRLFVLAHDACHGSFLTSRFLNRLVGRLGFLPSLTPYNLWELGHNTIHHNYTNLKGRDYVWTPFSKSEFDSLPAVRRQLERIYRGCFGHGLYYLVEIWWKKMMRPEKRLSTVHRRFDTRDRMLVIAYGVFWCGLACTAALFTGQSSALILALAVLLPFMIWNELMGFLIFLHHTHPGVAWFDKRSEWKSRSVQLEQAVHVAFPRAVDELFHHIMDHTAHHVDPTIPLNRLHRVQTILETTYPDDIPVDAFSWRYFGRCIAVCKLYDYDRHCWLDFEGNITARVNLSHPRGAEMQGKSNLFSASPRFCGEK
jgi:omega-6 fatty acid desaturase (delta-12 desaturase)